MSDRQPASAPGGAEFAVRMKGICKSFGPVRANQGVELSVPAGSIHGIVGENGAGKSTLMSILYGLYTSDSGLIEIAGQKAAISSSADAIRLGIGMVHQHFMLIPVFTVLENLMLGSEDGPLLAKGRDRARRELARLSEEYGLYAEPDALVGDLPVGVRQRVEILKALYRGAQILILDEPTGVLTPQEADKLFVILRAMRDQGKTLLLITHKLREVMDATDNVTVMRSGKNVADRPTSGTSPEELAELMVGRKVLLRVGKKPAKIGQTKLAVEKLSVSGRGNVDAVRDMSFEVCAGEIVGVAGVSGNGQSELLEALSGTVAPSSGSVRIGNRLITADNPTDSAELRELGLAHVPESRHEKGLVLSFSAEDCLLMGYHSAPNFLTRKMIDPIKVRKHAMRILPRFDVRPFAPELLSAKFSGGNQQKIVLGREIDTEPEVFLVGQPTRGVDIGAIEAIHRCLLEMREAGAAILLVSFELEEIMSLSDRIIVICAGEIIGEVSSAEANEKTLGLMMTGYAGSA